MKQLAELDQLNLDATAKMQVADMLQSLLKQTEKAAEQLHAKDAALQAKDKEIQQKDFKIQALIHELAHIRRIRYGVKNESLAPLQHDMFEESWNSDRAAIEAEIAQLAKDQPQGTAGKPQRPRAGRQPLPDHLPRIEHRHEPESCQCGQCGKDLVKIGEDVTEQLDVEPAKFFVHRHIRPQHHDLCKREVSAWRENRTFGCNVRGKACLYVSGQACGVSDAPVAYSGST